MKKRTEQTIISLGLGIVLGALGMKAYQIVNEKKREIGKLEKAAVRLESVLSGIEEQKLALELGMTLKEFRELCIDIKANPKKYVGFSLIGKKN